MPARRRLASALARRGIGRGDTVSVMLPNTPAMLECHYGVPDGRRRAQHAQHAPRCQDHRLLARAQRGQGADHGPGILRHRQGGPRIERAVKPLVIDYDDPEFTGAGRAPGRHGIRGAPGRRRSGLRLEPAAGRMGRDHAELHLRHHRRSEGRRLSPSRRLSSRHGQHPHRRHGAAPGLSVDAAHVPLQRLVLPLVALHRRRHPCLPARRAGQAHVRRLRRPRRHASVRRAHRHVDAAQCARRREAAPAAYGQVHDGRRAAAGGGAGGDEGRRLRRDASLRPDRGLRPRGRQRMA